MIKRPIKFRIIKNREILNEKSKYETNKIIEVLFKHLREVASLTIIIKNIVYCKILLNKL